MYFLVISVLTQSFPLEEETNEALANTMSDEKESTVSNLTTHTIKELFSFLQKIEQKHGNSPIVIGINFQSAKCARVSSLCR